MASKVFFAGLSFVSGSDDVPDGVKNVIGQSYDVAATNLWSWNSVFGFDFLLKMPDECLRPQPCQHGMHVESQLFDTTESWEKHFARSFGLDVSLGWGGIQASVAASTGDSFDDSGTTERNYFYHTVCNRKACYELSSECLMNPIYLNPRIKSVLARLSKGKYDAQNMADWVKQYVRLYGTHVVVASQHGAQVQSLTSQVSTCHASDECLKKQMCGKVGYMEKISSEICSNNTKCDKEDSCSEEFTDTCVVRGGSVDSSVSVCSKGTPVSSDDVQAFLTSGDMSSGSSAIGFKFMPMSQLFMYMGMTAEADTLEKAAAFHACKAPRFEWTEEHGCRCSLHCENGGVLDKTTCACKCAGDAKHGFTGPTCAATYGKCQPGPGTGNPFQAAMCAKSNYCSSWYNKKQCGPTEVCCLTAMKGKCCPFGSSCDCGSSNCKCVAPPSAMLV